MKRGRVSVSLRISGYANTSVSPNSIYHALPRPDATPSPRSSPQKDLPDAVSPARRVMPPWGIICHSNQPCGRHCMRTNSAAVITFLKSIPSNFVLSCRVDARVNHIVTRKRHPAGGGFARPFPYRSSTYADNRKGYPYTKILS